jgi:hypothetical protein
MKITKKSNKTTKTPKSFLLTSFSNSPKSIYTVSYLQPAIANIVGSETLLSAIEVSIVGTSTYWARGVLMSASNVYFYVTLIYFEK